MLSIIRTNSENEDFRSLVTMLDAELRIRDGEEHAFYSQFNKIDSLQEVVVAYLGEKAAGCGAIRRFNERTAEVKRMFVKTEDRGNGIAGKILGELEMWARELNFDECVLETGFKQPEAIALYKKSGYEVIPNYGQYAEVTNSLCMKKRSGDTIGQVRTEGHSFAIKTAPPKVSSRITLTNAFVVKNAAFNLLRSLALTRMCW